MRRSIDTRATLLAGIAMLALASAASAQPAPPEPLYPPDLDYAKHCTTAAAPVPKLDRDWTAWQGEDVALPADQLLAIAAEYARGSDRVEPSQETALRLLGYLEAQPNADRPRIDRLTGSILTQPGRSEPEIADGEARLLRALQSGETRAALDLARLYGQSGPANLRDPQKARAFAQTAAASGNADGKLLFATMVSADPNVAPEQKTYASEAAMLALVGDVVAGNCSRLDTIGLLYLRGDVVTASVPAALEWFKRAAETGDARTQERLGDLLSGTRVEQNDFPLALDYYQAAADQGRPLAALRVGQDYATGLIRPRDLERAVHYLGIAADGGARQAHTELARLYNGDFGGTPDWEAARQHYRAALDAGAVDPELATEFGTALIDNSTGPDDLAEAKALLTDAALAGSGTAAVKVGELLLDEARHDPALYTEVETFMRLGDSLGRSEAARYLAELSLCAGPLFDPSAVAGWKERALALGSENLILTEGMRLLGSADPTSRANGAALLRQVAVAGNPHAVAVALAELESPHGRLGDDPDLLDRLRTFAAGPHEEPTFKHDFDLARIAAQADLPDAEVKLTMALATLDAYIADGDTNAALLKAQLLKDRDAGPAERIPLYQLAADHGDAKGMRELGIAMLEDPNSDTTEARAWLEKAATAGDIKAALRLVDTTATTALASLQSITESGAICSVDTMVEAARTYAATIDPSAATEAARWLATAATVAADKPEELVRVASAYLDGIAGLDQRAAAEPLLASAAQLGDSEAALDLAEGHLDGLWPDSNPDTAHQLLADLAGAGNGDAAAELLRAVAAGTIDVPAAEAVALADQARGRLNDQGSTFSKLVRRDEAGAFGPPDPQRQLAWLQQAAEAGHAGSMLRLYRSYASGIGVTASPDLAVGWLQKAADIGDPRAARELAAAYTVGFGLEPDPERAAFWRSRAEVVN